jgi:putative ABC transport system permease protein
MENFLQDLRFGVRMLIKSPGFTIVAVVALALGIGANSAIFSVVNAILLRPLAYDRPEELVIVNHNYPKINLKASVSGFGYRYYRDNVKSFSSIAAQTGWAVNLTGVGEPERLAGMAVTPNFFEMLGAKAGQGRTFAAGEDENGKNHVAVLSHSFWKRRFGSNPSILNSILTLNGESYTVVGIMPPSFEFGREMGQVIELWSPLTFTPEQVSSNAITWEFLFVVARLKTGVPAQAAQAELDTIAANLRQQYMPGADTSNWNLLLTPFRELIVGDIKPMLYLLLGAVGLVLLIACANVANLLLARGAARQKEIAIRTSLGAGRARIIRQLLTESMLLALVGGALGLALGYFGVKLLVALNESRIPRANELGLDPTVFGFTALVSIVTGIVFGLFPALQISRNDLHEALKEGGRSGSGAIRSRVRNALVIVEMALALILLISAGLLIKSFIRVQQVNPGFRPENLLSMQVALPDLKYHEPAQRDRFFSDLIERVRALPGVTSAGVTTVLPMSGSNQSGSFRIEGREVPQGQSSPHGDRWSASSDYFTTMGIPLIRGRYFEERDSANAPGVAILDETMARKYWPDEDPIGKRLTFEGGRDAPIYREIVGIVGHVKHRGLEGESRVQYYIPFQQRPQASAYLVVRTSGEPTVVAPSVRATVLSTDRELPVFRVKTLETYVAESMAQRRFAMYLFLVFAGIALVLAAVGLYGVMAYSVSQRTHEIGVRMALGARGQDVVGMIVRQGLALSGIGLVAGLGAAFGLTRLLAALLFSVNVRDLSVFLLISLILSIVAVLASVIPARRATRVDPLIALRYE